MLKRKSEAPAHPLSNGLFFQSWFQVSVCFSRRVSLGFTKLALAHTSRVNLPLPILNSPLVTHDAQLHWPEVFLCSQHFCLCFYSHHGHLLSHFGQIGFLHYDGYHSCIFRGICHLPPSIVEELRKNMVENKEGDEKIWKLTRIRKLNYGSSRAKG